MQLMFYRNMFGTPRTCPTPALLWETGGMLMEVRIDRKKLLFYHHIWNLPDNSLAKVIAINQIKLNYPGLMTECKLLLVKYNLPEWENHTKLQWKKIVDKALKEYNKRTLLEKIKMYKKMEFEKLSKEDYEMKKYFLF